MAERVWEARLGGLVKVRHHKRGVSLYTQVVTPDKVVIKAVEEAAEKTGIAANVLLTRLVERAVHAGLPMIG